MVLAYGRATDDRDEAAIALVRITDYTSHAVSFLSRLLSASIALWNRILPPHTHHPQVACSRVVGSRLPTRYPVSPRLGLRRR